MFKIFQYKMDLWLKLSLLLCTFGFFHEMRASGPFMTKFLLGEWRNVTQDQLNRTVYPVGTYFYLSQVIVVFLITDFLRYKPLIVTSAVTGVIMQCLLLWTSSLDELLVAHFFYGSFVATEIAYYTYMYAKVDKEFYQSVTGNTRAAGLGGRFVASVVGQLLISFKWMDYRELNYITLGAQIISLVWAIFLPSVESSLYFYRKPSVTSAPHPPGATQQLDPEKTKNNLNNNSVNDTPKPKVKLSLRTAFKLLWQHFKSAYTNIQVLQWSFWWALSMCGFLQVQSYVQILWLVIEPEHDTVYNGAIEAALTLCGATAALVAGRIRGDSLSRWGLWVLTACSLMEGGALLLAALTNSIWLSYLGYVLFGALYQFMITVASAEVAKSLCEDSYALIFGINTLLALVFQSILTIIVTSESTGLELGPRMQFVVYGCYFVVLSAVYCLRGLFNLFFNPTQNVVL